MIFVCLTIVTLDVYNSAQIVEMEVFRVGFGYLGIGIVAQQDPNIGYA